MIILSISMKLITIASAVVVLAMLSTGWDRTASAGIEPSPFRTLGIWGFEEGSFFGGWGPGSLTVFDDSTFENDGYRHDPWRRVSYTTDAFDGTYALDFNNPTDTRPNPGQINFPHNASLEPATGMIEAQIKIDALPASTAIVFNKSTFQFVRTEPAPPIVIIGGNPRIIGRTVYDLEILPDGRLRAFVGNDGLDATPGNGGSPWTRAETNAAQTVVVGAWNHVAVQWDGCELTIFLNGVASDAVPYDPVPESGLSYNGAADDPTYGPLTLDLAISQSGFQFIGQIDEVKLSAVTPCNQFLIDTTEQLIDDLVDLSLPKGFTNSLTMKLESTVGSLGRDHLPEDFGSGGGNNPKHTFLEGPDEDKPAANALSAFIKSVEAQSGKKISEADADAFIARAEVLIANVLAIEGDEDRDATQ